MTRLWLQRTIGCLAGWLIFSPPGFKSKLYEGGPTLFRGKISQISGRFWRVRRVVRWVLSYNNRNNTHEYANRVEVGRTP